MKIKISLFKLSILLVLVFYSGYFLCSTHYKQKSERTEQAQAELRTDIHEIKRDFMPVIESAIKAFESHEEIIERNKTHPATAFVESEEE